MKKEKILPFLGLKKFPAAIHTLYFLSILAVALIPALLGKEQQKISFIYLSYWIQAGVILWWFHSMFKNLKWLIHKELAIAGLIALFASILVHLSFDHALKINSDEANLLSVARSLFHTHTPWNVIEAKSYFNFFVPVTKELAVRPIGFPFIIQIFHLLFGPTPTSAFFANALFGFTLFLLTITAWKKTFFGLINLMLLLSSGIISVCITSAGFDIASATLLYASIYLAILTLDPEKKHLDSLFYSTLAVFSSIRYESPAIALFILTIHLYKRKKIPEFILQSDSKLFLICLIPHFWLRNITAISFDNQAGIAVFSIGNLKSNGLTFWASIFTIEHSVSGIAFILGILGCFVSFSRKSLAAASVALFPVLFSVIFFGSYYAGDITQPTQTRFFLPVIIGAAYTSTKLIEAISEKIQPSFLFCTITLLFISSFSYSTQSKNLNSLYLYREMKIIYSYLEKQKLKNVIIIHNRPVQFTALGYGAFSHESFQQNYQSLKNELNNGLYEKIIIFDSEKFGKARNSFTSTKLKNPKSIFQINSEEYGVIYEMTPEI